MELSGSMSRKRRRRGRKNPIRRIFALVRKFLINIQEPSIVSKKRRRRRRRSRKNAIRRIWAFVCKIFSDRQQPSVNQKQTRDQRPIRTYEKRKSSKKAMLKIVSEVREITITRIQK